MTKKFLFILIAFCMSLIFISGAMAGNITLPTYAPSPVGSYDKLRLVPRSSDLGADGDACVSGLIYVEEGGDFHYCEDQGDGQNGIWSGISGVFTQEGDNIFPKNTLTNPGQNVGIGTSEPQSDLHVAGDFLYSGISPTLDLHDNDDGQDDFIINVDNDQMDIQTDGSGSMVSALTITSHGNIGIGTTTSPQAALQVAGNEILIGDELKITNSAPTLILEDTDSENSATDLKIINNDGWLRFQVNAKYDGPTTTWTHHDFEDRMRISSGSEGVWVSDNYRIEFLPAPKFQLYKDEDHYWLINTNAGGTQLYITSKIIEKGGYTKRLTAFQHGLYDGGGIVIQNKSAGPFTRIGFRWLTFGDSALGHNFYRPTTDFIYDRTSGAKVTAAGAWVDGSSRKIKKNIKPLHPDAALQTVNDLEVVTFNYKLNKKEPYVGFISEDVPGLVSTTSKETLDPMDFIGVLTKVVQGQQKKLKEQQKAFEKQNREIEKIKKRINKIK